MQGMLIKARKALYAIDLNSALYCLNMTFLHPDSYNKSAYFGALYQNLHLVEGEIQSVFLKISVWIFLKTHSESRILSSK